MYSNKISIEKNSVWIMYCSEKSDPYFSKFVTDKTIVPAVAVLSNQKNFLIVHSLDYNNVNNFEGTVLQYSGENSLLNTIFETLKNLNYPSSVYCLRILILSRSILIQTAMNGCSRNQIFPTKWILKQTY